MRRYPKDAAVVLVVGSAMIALTGAIEAFQRMSHLDQAMIAYGLMFVCGSVALFLRLLVLWAKVGRSR